MSEGIYWFDASGNKVTLEFSTQVPPTPGVNWTAVPELRSTAANPTPSDEIDFTSYDSDEEDIRVGLARRGTRECSAIFVPASAVQTTILALAQNKQQRWWRITYPLANVSNAVRARELFTASVQVASINPPDATATDPTMFNFTLRISGNYEYTKEAAA